MGRQVGIRCRRSLSANEINEFNATFVTSIYLIPKGKTNAGKHRGSRETGAA
jgi:hypothetical protein